MAAEIASAGHGSVSFEALTVWSMTYILFQMASGGERLWRHTTPGDDVFHQYSQIGEWTGFREFSKSLCEIFRRGMSVAPQMRLSLRGLRDEVARTTQFTYPRLGLSVYSGEHPSRRRQHWPLSLDHASSLRAFMALRVNRINPFVEVPDPLAVVDGAGAAAGNGGGAAGQQNIAGGAALRRVPR